MAVVGVGQLGSRYLQGLAKVNFNLDILAIDVNPNSLRIGRERWNETTNRNVEHSIAFMDSMDLLHSNFDLLIIATSANVRTSVLEQFISVARAEFVILEKVLAQSLEQLERIVALCTSCHEVWVNTPRRSMKWHSQIKESLDATKVVSVNVSGGNWGLACNAIHFIDLVAWWLNSKVLKIDTSGLERVWHPSKRSGHFEILGNLKVHYESGPVLHLSCTERIQPVQITIKETERTLLLDESEGTLKINDKIISRGALERQSDLSSLIVSQILSSGRCDLPVLYESVDQHSALIGALLNHWNAANNTQTTILPVT